MAQILLLGYCHGQGISGPCQCGKSQRKLKEAYESQRWNSQGHAKVFEQEDPTGENKLGNIKVGVHPNHALCSVVLKRLIRHGNMHHHFQPSKPLHYYPIISLCTLGKTCSSDGTQVSYKDHSGPTFSIVSLQQNCLCLKTVPMQMDTAQDMQLLGIGEA